MTPLPASIANFASPGTIYMVPVNKTDQTLVEVYHFMSSTKGQDKVRNALLRRRLPTALDSDIEEAVLSEATRFLANGNTIESPSGWCASRIAARALDLTRGMVRRDRDGFKVVDSSSDMTNYPEPVDQEFSLELSDLALTSLRKNIVESPASGPLVSGALTVVSVLAEQAELIKTCPQPATGATSLDAACWAGLWYAHQSDCFGQGNTVDQRRSRNTKRIKQLLLSLLAGSGLTEKFDV